MKRIFAPLVVAAMFSAAPAEAARPIDGSYQTGQATVVSIAPCGTLMCGTIERIVRPGAPTTDVNNPNEALRSRPIVGLPILFDFTEDGNQWKGTMYDPADGKTYRTVAERLSDGRLKVRACVLSMCNTQFWSAA